MDNQNSFLWPIAIICCVGARYRIRKIIRAFSCSQKTYGFEGFHLSFSEQNLNNRNNVKNVKNAASVHRSFTEKRNYASDGTWS